MLKVTKSSTKLYKWSMILAIYYNGITIKPSRLVMSKYKIKQCEEWSYYVTKIYRVLCYLKNKKSSGEFPLHWKYLDQTRFGGIFLKTLSSQVMQTSSLGLVGKKGCLSLLSSYFFHPLFPLCLILMQPVSPYQTMQ